MKHLYWTVPLILFILGTLGYVEKIYSLQLGRSIRILLFTIFIFFSIGNIFFGIYKEKKSAENFYSKEKIEIFTPENSKEKMRFYTDRKNNKCVILILENEPIIQSVKLFEGGYEAPPITLAFNGKEVIFKFSHYSSYEEYSNGGPIYQIKYYSRK